MHEALLIIGYKRGVYSCGSTGASPSRVVFKTGYGLKTGPQIINVASTVGRLMNYAL